MGGGIRLLCDIGHRDQRSPKPLQVMICNLSPKTHAAHPHCIPARTKTVRSSFLFRLAIWGGQPGREQQEGNPGRIGGGRECSCRLLRSRFCTYLHVSFQSYTFIWLHCSFCFSSVKEGEKEKSVSVFHTSLSVLCVLVSHPPSTSSCLHRLSLPSFPWRFHEQHSSEHKEGQTDQSNRRVKQLRPTRRSQVPGSKVREDNGCGVGGNFLPQGTGACGECVCVYILSGISIYSHGDPAQNGQAPNLLPDGWRRFVWLCYTYPQWLKLLNELSLPQKKQAFNC